MSEFYIVVLSSLSVVHSESSALKEVLIHSASETRLSNARAEILPFRVFHDVYFRDLKQKARNCA